MSHRFDPSILREYDVRGIVGQTLAEADALALGRAFGTVVRRAGGRRICVGRDGRLSSPQLEAALVEGLASTGLTVWRTGLGPTPMLYFATYELEADAGIMVTGSHNPPDHNGFKMTLHKASFFGADIQRLGEIAAAGDFETGAGTVEERTVEEAYVTRLCRGYRSDGRPLRVAWDAGNGAAGAVMAALSARLPGEHVLLNEVVDGTFPNHHPDPTVAENLAQLQACVRERGCDVGIAFDGDADRIGVVDEHGRILWGDQLMLLLGRDILSRHPGAIMIADVKASQILFDELARAGGRPVMWKTGHSLIKAKMAETGALLAGEMSGHIFIAEDYYGFDDGLYAAVRVIDLLSRSGQSLAAFRDSLPPVVNTPEIRFPVPESRKWAVVEEVRTRLAERKADVIAIDGVRVRTEDGWWLLRASNTQAVLVARCEARDRDGLHRLIESLTEQLRLSRVEVPADLIAAADPA
ncbi:MAG: phosphomannomutase/phosphoglucomutase [Alphaproteobacteria bacterium]|nr:MAG: phosphomannomutase/phosphoglucomutase [Alphaproteobacteria bacterium]